MMGAASRLLDNTVTRPLESPASTRPCSWRTQVTQPPVNLASPVLKPSCLLNTCLEKRYHSELCKMLPAPAVVCSVQNSPGSQPPIPRCGQSFSAQGDTGEAGTWPQLPPDGGPRVGQVQDEDRGQVRGWTLTLAGVLASHCCCGALHTQASDNFPGK